MVSRRLSRTIGAVLRVTDIAASIAGWELSFFIRFYVMEDAEPGLFRAFLFYSFILAALLVWFSTRNHLYESSRYLAWHTEFLLVMKSQLQAVAAFVILLYFIQPHRLSRITIGIYVGIGIVIALSSRGMIRGILKRARLHGRNLRRVLVVGRGKALNDYVELVSKNPEIGLSFIGWAASGENGGNHDIPPANIEDIPLEGPDMPDAVIIGYDSKNHGDLDEILAVFNKTHIQTLIIPDIENAFIGYTIEDFHGLPMISVNSSRIIPVQAFLKRIIDIVGSLIGLVISSPLLLIISILVKVTSKGPVFFGQERMTQDGDTFIMWKFRSMRTDAEDTGARWAAKNDDRRTPLGTFLRSSSLDEFPQFWNVLRGEMSLVGPRPERPVFIEQFKHQIPSYMLRHRMKSGITGWAQVNGWRGDTSLEKRIEFDLYYIRNWSLFLDFKILILTIIKGFVHENAY